MYAREREARIAAENQLAAERQRFAEQRDEERRRSDETHQALLAALAGLTDKIAELSGPNRGNGQ